MIIHIRTRAVITAILCVALIFTAPFLVPEEGKPASAQINDWGLSFNKQGEPPKGNAEAEYLEQYDAYFLDTTPGNKIYLTFDAGFENGYTGKILHVLKKHNAKATFFLVGNYLDTAPAMVKRMAEEGHIVANHTLNHPDMSKIGDKDSFAKELCGLEEKYKALTGKDMPKIYRPPQGKFNEENLKMAKDMGYKTVFWSLAYVDWYTDNQPTPKEAFDKLVPRIHPGAVVLLHSTSETNAEILDELLTKWEKAGYVIAPITELVYSQLSQTSGQ